MMRLFLFFFLGFVRMSRISEISIQLGGTLGNEVAEADLTTCKIADNVKSALYILDLMPADNFITDMDALKVILVSALQGFFPALSSFISTASDEDLFDLASMEGMLSNLDDLVAVNGATDWENIANKEILRIGFEQLALLKETDQERRNYLSTFMTMLTTREVLTLSCASQGATISIDGRRIINSKTKLDGCYDALTDFESLTGFSGESRYHCLDACRTANKMFSVFVGTNDCKCSNIAANVAGTYAETCGAVAATKMLKTGLGEPIKTKMDDGEIGLFDPLAMEFREFVNDELICIQEVEMVDGDSEIFISALFKKAIALFKAVDTNLELVDWKRWDCPTKASNNDFYDDHCLHEVSPQNNRATTLPGFENLDNGEAVSFTNFNVLVTLNHTMALNSEEPFDTIKEDPTKKTSGDPMVFPGGKMVNHILITFPTGTFFPMILLRLEDEKLIHMTESGGPKFFGQFILTAFPEIIPHIFTHRVIGRDTYLFAGITDKDDSTDAEGAVKLYTVKEEPRKITDYAFYGAIEMDEVEGLSIPTFSVQDIIYAQTIYPLLIVLDIDPEHTGNQEARIRVYRISKFKTVDADKPLDEIIVDKKYTSLEFISLDTGKYVLLKSADTMIYLEISTKGIFTRDIETIDITFNHADVEQFGRLKDNVIISTVSADLARIEFHDLKGNKLVETTTDSTRDYKTIKCVSRDGYVRCFAGSFMEEKARFDMFEYFPYTKLDVVSNDITLTNWEASKQRINNMFDDMTPIYNGLIEKQKDYLMTEGSVVPSGSSWQLSSLKASNFTGASGVLDGTAVTMNVVNPDTSVMTGVTYIADGALSASNNVRGALDIQLTEVRTKLDFVTDETVESSTKFESSKLSLASLEPQTINDVKVSTLDVITISSVNPITVNELKSTDGTTKLLSTINSDTFLRNNPQPLVGIKTFNNLITIDNLETAQLTDEGESKVSVSPADCFVKNRETTITVPQIFDSPVTINTLKMLEDASIVDLGSTNLKKADLVPHKDRTGGLPGFFSFQDAVSANGLKSHINGFELTAGDAANMALKETANTIAGDLTVNIVEGTDNKASGTSILLQKDILLNNVDLYEKKQNAVRTSCDGCTDCSGSCADNVVQINSPVTFVGMVSAPSMDLTTVNSLNFDTFIDRTEFNNKQITITGKKTLSNVNAAVLKASTFHGLELDSLLTTNSVQQILSRYTFNKVSVFDSISAPEAMPCVTVDEMDLCLKFKADLEAVEADQSWIESNTIDTDVKFNQLTIASGANINFDNLVNSMTVADEIEKIVTDENKAFTITGTKTMSSPITLQSVQSSTDAEVNIISGTDNYVISDFVNTETTTEITGAKTFSSAVSVEDIFAVGTTLINDLSVAHMLHCFVDKNSALTDDIHIYHPVHYDSISVPRLEVLRNPEARLYSIVPMDTTIQTAAKFIDVVVGEKSDSALKSEIISKMSTDFTITIPDDDNVATNIMFSYVLKDLTNINDCDFQEKRNQMNLRLNDEFGLTLTSVQAKTDLEVLQTEARNPKINTFDPKTDLAILDQNNVFCTADVPCIQNFDGGIEAGVVEVSGNLKILDEKLVHTVNPSDLDSARVSLSKANNDVASKKFTSLRMDSTDGVFTGSLQIETSDGFISSTDFASKFLSTTTAAELTQTLSGSFVMGAIQADSITTNQLKVNEQIIDISNVDSVTFNVDDDLTFETLTFNDAITIDNAITVAGTVEGQTISDFHDLLVSGADIVVDSSTSIAGTDRAELTLGGTKVLSSLTVANLKATKDESGKLYPDFAYLPCTKSEQIEGPLTGTLVKTETGVLNVEDCQDKCRENDHGMCYGISFAADECRIYSSYEAGVVDETIANWNTYVSFTFECCSILQAKGSEVFLSVDENDAIITSSSSDFWCFANNDKIVHKSTDKVIALDGENLLLSDVPRSSSKTATRTEEEFTFTGQSVIQIQSKSNSKWMNKAMDGSVTLEDSAPTEWEAFMGGVIMSEIVEGEIKPRLLLKSKDQTVTGALAIQGDLTVEDTTLITQTISTLSHDDVTTVYSYNSGTSTHEISTNYEITGDSLAITNLNSPSYNPDLDDFIQLDQMEDLALLGTTIFTDVTFIKDLTVEGLVADEDIADLNNNLARNHDGVLTFTEKNTFSQNMGNDATLISTGLTSTVDMTLGNSQIENGVDVTDLRAKTILNDDASATIQGTVNFDTILVSAGEVTIGKANLNGAGEIHIPAAFIQTTDSSIDLTSHKVGTFKAKSDMTIKGQLFGHDAVKFLDVLYKDGAQTITADLEVTGQLTAAVNLVTTTINGFTPQTDLILLNGEVTMDADTTFTQTLTFTDVVVTGNVDGYDFLEKFKNSVAVLDADNTISEKWTFESVAQFDGDVLGSKTTADHYINEQRVSDMNAACDLHDNMYAVKISAQAEASVLCDFVSDLQDSYLSSQIVVHYKKKSSTSYMGKTFTNSIMKTIKDDDRVILFVMNGLDLEIYHVDGSNVNMLKMLTTMAFTSGVMPKIQLVIDLSGVEGFSFLIFIGTGIPGDSVKMLKFSGTSSSNTLESMGSLADATTVSEVNMHYIVVLKHTLNMAEDALQVSLFGYACHHLKLCETDCANVNPDVLLDVGDLVNGEISVNSMGQILDAVSMCSIKVLTGQYVVAFNMKIKAFAQNVIRIVTFESTEGVFSLDQDLIDSSSSSQFELAIFDAKLFVLSVGSTFEMKEINVELGTLVDRNLATTLSGTLTNLHVNNDYGSGYGISVLRDGMELITMKYWGLDGLHITDAIKLNNFYTSIAGSTAIVDSTVVYMKALVGTDQITILQGDFASQNQFVKFECAKPEIPAAWASDSD